MAAPATVQQKVTPHPAGLVATLWKTPAPKKPAAPTPQAPKVPVTHAAPPKKPGAKNPTGVKAPKPVNPLAPLSPGQIKNQATKTIMAAYAPAVQGLNQQQTTAQNLSKAQQTDDDAFEQWLSTNQQALQSQVANVNQKLSDVATQNAVVRNQLLSNAATNIGNAAAGPGSSSSAASVAAAPAAQSAQGISNSLGAASAGSDAQAAEDAMTSNYHTADGGTMANAIVGVTRQNELNQLNTTLTNIANQRTKLNTSRTGDIAKEIARLQGVEISKAQYQENQSNLAAETGIKQQDANTQATNAKTNQVNANTKALAQSETALHNANEERIQSTHYATVAQQQAAQLAETERHNKVDEGISQQKADKAAGVKVPKLTLTQQNAVSTYISTLQNYVQQAIQRAGGDPSAAYHNIRTGVFFKNTGQNLGAPPAGTDPVSLLNAAFNLQTGNGLSPGDVAYMNHVGMPTSGYKIHQQRTAPTAPGAR